MRNNAELFRFERLDGGNEEYIDDPANIAEAIRISAPTCGVNAHLNYVIAIGIDVWNGDPEHIIDVIPYFTKPDIED